MKICLSFSLALSLLFPTILLAEDWANNNFPVSNFSFEQYDEVTHHFPDWELGNTETMEPEFFDQCLMPSLHYTACAHIVEDDIGQYEESCYLQNTFISAPETRYFNGKPCYLVAFVKCTDVSSTNGGGVFAEVNLPGESFDITYTSQVLTGEHNWCKLIVPFTFPTVVAPPFEAQQIHVRVGLRNATGEVWIDYVQIVQMETAVEGALYTSLENPSFDRSPGTLWGWTPYLPPKINITADATNHMNGPISAKFSVTGSQPPEQTAYLSQNVSTDIAAHTYYASAFVKTDNLLSISPSNPGAKLHIIYPGLDWYSQSIVGSQKWTRIQGTFDKPAVNMPSPPDLTLKLETTAYAGSAWFDWVTLKLNPVQNPGFNDWHGLSPPPDLMVWNKEGEGDGGYSTAESHSATSCGYIENSNNHFDTILSQPLWGEASPSLREGATYLLTGWIKTVEVDPLSREPGGEGGAFVELGVWKDDDFITLVSSEPQVGSTAEWQEFSFCFSLPLDYFITETDDLYSMKNDGLTTFDYFEIRCRLFHASGTAYFDDVNLVELEPTDDLATVVPQPQAYQSFGYFSDPLVSFNPSKVVTIYYTPDDSPDPELGDTYQFSANNLQQELNRAFYDCTGVNPQGGYTGWEDIKYNYPIPVSNIKKLDGTVTSLAKPCIILGDPSLDGSSGHLFQNELLKRGMVLPQDISPEGYIMQIDQETILIAASDSEIITQGENDSALVKGAGSFYGTETLLQMLDIEQRSITPINCPGGVTYLPNKVVAPACYIYDYPDMVWRGQMSYMGFDIQDDEQSSYPKYPLDKQTGFLQGTDNNVLENRKLFAQQMARFKMNRLSIFSTVFFFLNYNSSDDEKTNHWYMESLFSYCRKLHIEPIPLLGNYYDALLRHNGNCLECSIFDSQYIEDNGLVPGPGDYYYTEPTQGINQYPYPMPQPSWEFIVDSGKNNYFAENKVEVWNKGEREYEMVDSECYRVFNDISCPITVEVWNEEQEKWDPLTSGYTLNNVGLNHGDTSYYRFNYAGFYGDDQEDWAYITFDDPSLNGKKVRISYAAPINMKFIWSWWGDRPLPQRFSTWTCMSYFDDSAPPDPVSEDTPANWTGWNSRDIWYVTLYEIIDWLKPRYIDIQHCEQWIMHLDKRCQVERKNDNSYPEEEQYGNIPSNHHNAFIFGKEIDWLEKQVDIINGQKQTNTQLMLFADMFDSHNGRYAEGRCQWNWYPNYDRDPVHQPDIDDNWVGNVESHIYYQPAMGGMGGWTWNTNDPGMMASEYVDNKENIVCWEWGYQDGYFDDRDPENVILWQDKFEERYRELALQGFTNFVGGCAGYALALEGRDWGGITIRCKDLTAEGDVYYPADNPLDGTNLNWALIKGKMEKGDQDEIGINLYLNACAKDPVYSAEHLDPDTQKGCHIGTVQDGVAYLDDVSLKDDNVGKIILNPNFTVDLRHWEIHPGVDFAKWEWNGEEGHNSPGCCRFTIDRDGYSYNTSYEYIQQHYSESLGELKDLNLEFSVWAKTIKLDGLRHLNVKSWMDLTYDYQPHEQEIVLGMINTQWGEVRNYSSESTSADWMWSKKYPASAFIKYLYCDPYYLFQGDNMNNWGDQFQPNAPYPKDAEEVLP